jgi:hypothetical protein
MGKKIIIVAILLSIVLANWGQRIDDRTSLFSASATISPGYMFSQKEATISVHGFAELFVQTNISIKADGYWFLSGKNEGSTVFQNTGGFFGGAYHFTKEGKLDPWIALQPGVSYVAMNSGLLTSENTIAPLLSTAIGVTFQMNRWFNLYAQGRYIAGNAKVGDPYNSSLHEFRVSFGLGFSYINANKCGTCPHWK